MNDLISMKRPKPKPENSKIDYPSISHDDYPYGLKIDLNKPELSKLGLDVSKTKVGTTIVLVVECNVDRVSKTDSIGSSESRESMDLQIRRAKVIQNSNDKSNDLSHKQVARPK